ncbi:MAG: hypothetical protein KIH08_15795, partial [Candidatus Freyarchaeota archaeon]|nr:hypothetical protein [Candidatus Jordarchaeia archaeon]
MVKINKILDQIGYQKILEWHALPDGVKAGIKKLEELGIYISESTWKRLVKRARELKIATEIKAPPVEDFEKLVGLEDFKKFVMTKTAGKYILSFTKKMWENCLKPQQVFDLKTPWDSETRKKNIIAVADWLNQIQPLTEKQESLRVTARYLFRYRGVSRVELEMYGLGTTGFEPLVKRIEEFEQPGFEKRLILAFSEAVKILKEIDKMVYITKENMELKERVRKVPSRIINNRERACKELELVLWLKFSTGIRTGDPNKETELWGTKIGYGTGKTYLYFPEGRLSWHVFAKKGEVWEIKLLPPNVDQMLRQFIIDYQLKDGDYLINVLDRQTANYC